MNDKKMSWEQAISYLRTLPKYSQLIKDAYLNEDPIEAAMNYARSEEWEEIQKLLTLHGQGHGQVLDIGAGNGIASYAFSKAGFEVFSLEPDPGKTVGTGAIRTLIAKTGINIKVLEAVGEKIPLPDESIDLVFARQVLHHAFSLKDMCCEIHRVLKRNGLFLAVREHVISAPEDLNIFLEQHPVHKYYGGENAYLLEDYLVSISSAGFKVERVLGLYDSVINYAPTTRNQWRNHLTTKVSKYLPRFFAKRLLESDVMLTMLSNHASKTCNLPGRLYSFLAVRR